MSLLLFAGPFVCLFVSLLYNTTQTQHHRIPVKYVRLLNRTIHEVLRRVSPAWRPALIYVHSGLHLRIYDWGGSRRGNVTFLGHGVKRPISLINSSRATYDFCIWTQEFCSLTPEVCLWESADCDVVLMHYTVTHLTAYCQFILKQNEVC